MQSIPNIISFSRHDARNHLVLYSSCVLLGLAYLFLPVYLFLTVLVLSSVLSLGIIKPEYSFYLMVLVFVEEMAHLYISFAPYYDVRIYPYQLVLIATAVGLGFVMAQRRRVIRTTPIDIVILVIVSYELISLTWAPIFNIGLFTAIYLITQVLLFYITTSIVVDEATLRRTVKTIVFAGVICSTSIALSQWIDVSQSWTFSNMVGLKVAFQEQVDRPAGLAGVDHVAGFTSMAAIIVMAYMVWNKSLKARVLYFLLLIYLLYGIVLTTSRGVVIGIIGAFVFFLLVQGNLRRRFIKYFFLFSVLSILVVLISKPGFIDRMLIGFGYTGDLIFSEAVYKGTEAATEMGEGLSGLEIRWIWWKNALDEMARNPLKILFGLGISGFIYYSAGSNTVTSPEVNSVSFAFFYDMGLVGMVLLLILIYICAKHFDYWIVKARKTYCHSMMVAAITAVVSETVIHGLVDYDLTSYGAKYFWFPLGLAMAAMNIVKRENSSEQKEGGLDA